MGNSGFDCTYNAALARKRRDRFGHPARKREHRQRPGQHAEAVSMLAQRASGGAGNKHRKLPCERYVLAPTRWVPDPQLPANAFVASDTSGAAPIAFERPAAANAPGLKPPPKARAASAQ